MIEDVTLKLAVEGLPEHRVYAADGVERMHELSRWTIELVVDEPVEARSLLGKTASLTLIDELEGSTRASALLVVGAASRGPSRDGELLRLDLSDPLWLLTRKSDRRVFLEKTTVQIVQQVLEAAGIASDALVLRLRDTYASRLQCVQVGESDWAFVSRLLAEEGIASWFETNEDGLSQWMLADSVRGHEGIEGSVALPLTEPTGQLHGRAIYALARTKQIVTEKTHVRRYDVRNPSVFIEGRAGTGVRELFEYPAKVLDEAGAKHLARVRMEQVQRDRVRAEATSDCIRVQPGRRFDVVGSSEGEVDGRYLVVEVVHRIVNDATMAGARVQYRNTLQAMFEDEERTYRPKIPAQPRLATVESVISTGPAGEEIHVDDLGAVKHRFLWDRSGIQDDTSSEWARTLQMGMGGTMFLPRVGWELPMMYVDGDPDQPFSLGRLYNGTAVPPYALPGGNAMASIQSATSPGDGTTNEIRMGDAAGGMELFVHASKDQTVNVGGSATTKVSANATHDVTLASGLFVDGSQTHTVGSNQEVSVVTDHALVVKGSRSEMIGGMELVDVTGNRYVGAKGAYTELVGAAYMLQCNQANYRVSGAYTLLVGGSYGNTAAMTIGESVAAARTELVGGGRTIVAAQGVVDQTTGAKSVTAGATNEQADGKVITACTGAGAISVGGSMKITASGDVEISAPNITIRAASLKAKALQLSGGTFKAKSGTTSFKGKVKRQGKTELQ